MNQIIEFFKNLFDSSDWPPKWHCGRWTDFHGWLYIVSDLIIWSAYFSIPLVILRYIFKRPEVKFIKLYFLFASFILFCGATHFLDAVSFWVPLYRLNALFLLITGIISWLTVYYLVKYLPLIFSLRPQKELEFEIEQRKNAEAALNKLNEELEQRVIVKTQEIYSSEKRFRAMIENTNDFINVTNESLEITYRSPSSSRVTGWSNEEKIGTSLYLDMHPVDQEKARTDIEEALANPGKFINSLLRMRHKNGHYIWLEGIITNLLQDESVKGVVFNYHDVTERVEEHEKLLASEVRYRRLFEAAKDGILILNIDSGIIEDVNPFLITMLGYSHNEFLGKELWQIGLYKDILENKSAFQILKKEGYLRYDNLPLQTKGKQTVWVEFVSNIYDVNGSFVVQCNIRDIGERKKAEEEIKDSNERFEMVTRATNDIIWDWNMDTDKLWWNNNYYTHFGFDKNTSPVDKNSWLNSVYPGDLKRVRTGIDLCIETHQKFWTDEYRFLKADGSIAFILDCGYVLYNNVNKPYRMVGAMLDITDRKTAEEALKVSYSEKKVLAERMSTILNTITADIALLDGTGSIIEVNDSWKKFAMENGYGGNGYGVQKNYTKISEGFFGDDISENKKVARGINDVLKNKRKEFIFEYSRILEKARRWFRLVVTQLQGGPRAGAVVMQIDISELRRLEREKLESKIQEQIHITEAILKTQENERNYIAQELHDNVNQILAGTNLVLSIAKNQPAKCKEHVESAMANILQAIEENRKIAHNLISPDFETIPLSEQIMSLATDMLKASGIDIYIDTSRFQETLIMNKLKLSIYRIAQEQCTNILKYADATLVNIFLETNAGIFRMSVEDNGKGMEKNKKQKGIGLKNIRARLLVFNGEAHISSSSGKGFTMQIEIPLIQENKKV
jgi:PAS domain S-box-containing protein